MERRRQKRHAKDETPEMAGTDSGPPWMEENCWESQDSTWVVTLIEKNKKKKINNNNYYGTGFMYKENRLFRRHILSLHTVDRGSIKDKSCTYFL
jgi:hypothetical protein